MKKPLLVIIDDEPDSLDLLRYNFTRKGYEAMTFVDMTEAWDFISQNQPDIILYEGGLVSLDGPSLCKQIKQVPSLSHIPVVILSYQTDKVFISKALQEGALDYIIKPIKAYELVERVDHLIYQHLMVSGGRGQDVLASSS